ncbi:unnamed protein product [Paramecium pentaurelia]|uniref:Uncharacterized protein n=1 Tax=Paramecium pentaurelia TaxID=43138 RepID=A0A8S1WMS3_9CILI|nr:unnamed protein product [Paramecium pentaurelia]
MLSQRCPAIMKKVEFGNITKGLQRQCSEKDLMNQQQQNINDESQDRTKLKLLNQRLQTQSNENPIRTDLSTAEGLQLQENKSDEKKQKFDKLKRQPPTFFEKIPKDPLTLMNSTRKNKYIQINILAKSKQAVKDHIVNHNLPQQSPAQDAAVRELLDSFQTQFNFRTAIDAKKKRQVEDLKAKYLKTFFIKNIPTKDKVIYKYYGENQFNCFTNRDDRFKLSRSQIKNECYHKPFTQSFQTQTQTFCNESNSCTGYCQYLKEIYKKNHQSLKNLSELTSSN